MARNFAISKSKGDYLVFLDDDAQVKEDFIEILSREVAVYSEVNAFCGRLIDQAQNIPFSPLFYSNNIKKLQRMQYQYFMGSAHVLSRRIIDKIGAYDERFGFGSKCYHGAEETDIFFRLKIAKEQVIYLPELTFFHPAIYPSPSYVYNYGYVLGVVLTKNCIHDKACFYVYFLIVLEVAMRGFIRLLQRPFSKEIKKKDQTYHYGTRIKGLFSGIKGYIVDSFFTKKKERVK